MGFIYSGKSYFLFKYSICYWIYFGVQTVPDLASGSPFMLPVSLWYVPTIFLSTSLLSCITRCSRLIFSHFCSSLGISCFSKRPSFLLWAMVLETKMWALGVLTAIEVSLLSADSVKNYMHIYIHIYTHAFMQAYTYTYTYMYEPVYIHTLETMSSHQYLQFLSIPTESSLPSPIPQSFPFFYSENPSSQNQYNNIHICSTLEHTEKSPTALPTPLPSTQPLGFRIYLPFVPLLHTLPSPKLIACNNYYFHRLLVLNFLFLLFSLLYQCS